MRHSPFTLYPRTALFTAVWEGLLARTPIEDRTLDEIQRARGGVYPDRPPFSWVAGGGNRRVGVTYGTAPARDGHEIPLRLYRPRDLRDTETDAPVVVFLHG